MRSLVFGMNAEHRRQWLRLDLWQEGHAWFWRASQVRRKCVLGVVQNRPRNLHLSKRNETMVPPGLKQYRNTIKTFAGKVNHVEVSFSKTLKETTLSSRAN